MTPLQQALAAFVAATRDLNDAWVDGEGDALSAGYPPSLPSFDEFLDEDHSILSELGGSILDRFLGEDASPIERHMLAGIAVAAVTGEGDEAGGDGFSFLGESFDDRWLKPEIEKRGQTTTALAAMGCYMIGTVRANGQAFYVFPQFPIGPYRADFALISSSGFLVVECDGHDFHERTKEQAAHDRKRDRFMVADGWTVLRFTGSEIHRDPVMCGREVLANCKRLVDEKLEAIMRHHVPSRGVKPRAEDL